jgi:hypothetical protein
MNRILATTALGVSMSVYSCSGDDMSASSLEDPSTTEEAWMGEDTELPGANTDSPSESPVEPASASSDSTASESVSPTAAFPEEMLAHSTVSLDELRASLERVTREEGSFDQRSEPSSDEASDGLTTRGKLDPEMLRFLIATRERMEAAR